MTVSEVCCILFMILLQVLHKGYGADSKWSESYANVLFGRHFDGIATHSSFITKLAARNTFLILYRTSCADKLTKLLELPMYNPQYVTIVKHNVDDPKKYIWYDMDAVDDLATRFNFTDDICPLVLYFQEGQDIRDPVRLAADALTDSFIWQSLLVTVKIKNTEKESLTVELFGGGPKIDQISLGVEEVKELSVYHSYALAASRSSDGTFIYGTIIKDATDVIITNFHKSFDDWENEERLREQEASDELMKWRRNVEHGYMKMIKQTVLLPKFTDAGYKKMRMPPEVYDSLATFYQNNRNSKLTPEKYSFQEGLINLDKVTTGMVLLPSRLQRKLDQALKPVVESWVGCELKHLKVYGVREYYRGSTLRMHTDNIDYAISIILQIFQDLGDTEPWPLEIINFEGQRKNLTLEAGEMLFYESATLPHGRPYPFQGIVFANAFFHYKPKNGWMFKRDISTNNFSNGTFVESLYKLQSTNIDKSNPQRNTMYRWSELQSLHEEL